MAKQVTETTPFLMPPTEDQVLQRTWEIALLDEWKDKDREELKKLLNYLEAREEAPA